MIAYATKDKEDGNSFINIFPDAFQVKMCLGSDPTDIYKIDINESPTGTYWGWKDTGEEEFCMIYPAKFLLEMCFTYGMEYEIKKGRGTAHQLDVREIEIHKKGAKG